MAKRKKFSYKNLKINQEELAVTKIGEMPNINKSPLFLLVIFGILLVFIFFLPDVVKYITNEDGTVMNNGTNNSDSNDNPDDMASNDLEFYDLKPNLSLNIEDGIVASDFVLSNNQISFKVTNNLANRFYFGKHNYFIELYDNDRTLLERIILGKDAIAKGESLNFNFKIKTDTQNNATQIVFVEKTVDDYPNITLNKNSSGDEILVCTHNGETINYTFQNDQLKAINDLITQNAGTNNYQQNLYLWQSKVASYNQLEGFTATLSSTTNGFNVNIMIDIATGDINGANNNIYYSSDNLPKVINFEMEARGFDCN